MALSIWWQGASCSAEGKSKTRPTLQYATECMNLGYCTSGSSHFHGCPGRLEAPDQRAQVLSLCQRLESAVSVLSRSVI